MKRRFGHLAGKAIEAESIGEEAGHRADEIDSTIARLEAADRQIAELDQKLERAIERGDNRKVERLSQQLQQATERIRALNSKAERASAENDKFIERAKRIEQTFSR